MGKAVATAVENHLSRKLYNNRDKEEKKRGKDVPAKIDRTGEKRIANCGMEMEIVAYRNSRDIDVRFENGVIKEHCFYASFHNGSIGIGSIKEQSALRLNKRQRLRLGEKRMANCGMEMEIVAYRKADDIDVRFEDGTIVEHRTYSCFLKGSISPVSEKEIAMSRVGEKRIANCGMGMEIVAYRNVDDIDVRFEDGVIVKHCRYKSFKLGQIARFKYKEISASRIGEKRIANNGMEMEIVAYRKTNDIDVRFEDGTIVEHRTYSCFLKGSISPVSEKEIAMSRVGEKRIANCGMGMEIVAYRNVDDIDVRFEDGAIVNHCNYQSFRIGQIPRFKYKEISASRIGEKRIANNGMEMEIIAYRSSTDIDVQFENGMVVKHRRYDTFCAGTILPISAKEQTTALRVGEKNISCCGIEMKIVAYRSGRDVDVMFSDGNILEHRNYIKFRSGQISHPAIGRHRKSVFYDVFVCKVFKDGDKVYYTCTFPDGTKDICTLQEVMERMHIEKVF